MSDTQTPLKHLVIDGYGLIYRAYFAFFRNPLTNSKGQNVSALYGFVRFLLKLLQELKPDSVTVALDAPTTTFRHHLYSDYKANREKMPEDLQTQLVAIKKFLQLAKMDQIELPGFEADDIMGSIASTWKKADNQVIIVSGDKDILQLLPFGIEIFSPQKGIQDLETMDITSAEQKIGLPIHKFIDYLALVGDQSDNVPGVKGIGPKGAITLLQQFPDLEQIYANIDQIHPKGMQIKLAEGRDSAFLSRQLVTIRTDLPIPQAPQAWSEATFFSQEMVDFFSEQEMPSLVEEIVKGNPALSPSPSLSASQQVKINREYLLIRTAQEFDKLLEQWGAISGWLAIDTETTSSQPMLAELIGISLCKDPGKAYYIHLQPNRLVDPGIALSDIAANLQELINTEKLLLTGQNYKYDFLVLRRHGIELPPPYLDTMVASYVLQPGDRRHNLDSLARQYLGETMISFDDLVGRGRKKVSITEVTPEDLCNYAAEDADMTLRLAQLFERKLKEEKLWNFYQRFENPLVFILAEMESAGVAIDVPYLSDLSRKMHSAMQQIEKEIYQIAGRSFNLNSTQELQQILFQDLGLRTVKKTKTGQSTDISVLEALQGDHKIIDHLIAYRSVNKLLNTYVDALPKLIHPHSGRIHSSFNQTVAATGRLSSSDPNLQNIPVKDENGRAIRKAFIPQTGSTLLSADYSQIELRILAHFSGDPELVLAYQRNEDIHRITAGNIFHLPASQISPSQRRIGKTINFSVIYGQTPFGLAKQIGVSQTEAADYIKKYFAKYQGVASFKDKVLQQGREQGFITTLFGRKRYIDGLNDKNRMIREAAERMAFNSPIQGTASDIIKLAMIEIDVKIKELKLRSRLILQVHDELLYEVHPEEREIVSQVVQQTMEEVAKLAVPLQVDLHFGDNWEAAH